MQEKISPDDSSQKQERKKKLKGTGSTRVNIKNIDYINLKYSPY